jgi:hypothetical protein
MTKHAWDLDAERLFAGVDAPDPDQALTRFAHDVRVTFAAPPPALTRALHLSAMAVTRSDPSTTEMVATARPRRGRRFVVRGGLAAAALVLVGGSAMAATGMLPDAAQDAISDVARRIGVKLPRAHTADIQRLPLDIERPVVKLKVADDPSTADRDADRDRDRDRDADDDSGSISSVADSNRDSRRNRRSDDGPTTVVPAQPEEPSSDDDDDPSDATDGRGDPTDDGNGNGDGEPVGGGGGDPDGDADDADGRGDPVDGSPNGAGSGSDNDAATDDDADDGAGSRRR